jgi:hypothetical protein
MTFQQILIMSHPGKQLCLREEIQGWSEEFGNIDYQKVLKNPEIHVGMLRGIQFPRQEPLPKTAAHALRMGWKLLSFSSYKLTSEDDSPNMVEIVMVRDVDKDGVPI